MGLETIPLTKSAGNEERKQMKGSVNTALKMRQEIICWNEFQ